METITRQWGQDKISQLETLFLQKAIIQEGQTIKTMGWCITELNNKLVNKNYASYSPEEKMQSAELSTLRSELPQHQANLSRLQRYQEQQATKTGNIRQ
jgi:hypothetical protein